MRLIPIKRNSYRVFQDSLQTMADPCLVEECLPELIEQLPKDTLVIPEGGSNLMAIESLADAYRPIFTQALYQDVTHVVCATGTGATVAGLQKAAPSNVQVIGVQVVAEGSATIKRIGKWLEGDSTMQHLQNLNIVPGHLGGFARMPSELLAFIRDFEAEQNIPLDPIYNGKVLFKLSKMSNEGFFRKNDKVLVIHTGGLQGRR